jgi:hypothetical protein
MSTSKRVADHKPRLDHDWRPACNLFGRYLAARYRSGFHEQPETATHPAATEPRYPFGNFASARPVYKRVKLFRSDRV